MDNVDGGCTTCNNTTNPPIPNGSRVDVTFTFQYPVLLSALRVDDIDASDIARASAGQSSFQDQVIFSATGINGANVPLNLTPGSTGLVTLSGQTATANWASGVNNNVSENDPLGQVTASSSLAVKSVTISYLIGPNAVNTAQQGIRIGTFNFCCPVVVDLAGTVFKDCNALIDNTVNGTGLGNPASTTLYANLVEPVSNRVIGVATVAAAGTYSIPNIPGNVTYNVVLSTTAGTVGSAPPVASLPANWTNTGEFYGTGVGDDGSANGTLTNVVVGSVNATNANFGIRTLPTCSVVNSGPVCVGGTATFTESGLRGTSWSWVGPNGFTSTTRNPSITGVTSAANGIYTVTVTNVEGCTITCTTNLVVNPLPVVTASSNTPVCFGTSINLTSSGGTSYSWSGPSGFTSTLQNPVRTSAAAAMTGVYSVTVTNASGCTASATTYVVVTPDISVTASASPVSLCVGGSFSINGTVTNGVYKRILSKHYGKQSYRFNFKFDLSQPTDYN